MVEATMSASPEKPAYLPGLGGVRGLATLAVLVGHALAWLTPLPETPALYEPFARLTRCGLSAFFVLSGFVLAYNHGAAMASGNLSFGRFAMARLARLLPVYLLTLTLAAGLALAKHGAGSFGGAGNLITFATLTQSWVFMPLWPQIFPLSWALSVEVFFYLTFPLAARLLARAATPRAALCMGLAAMAAILALDALGAVYWPQLFTVVLARQTDWPGTPGELAGLLFQWLFYSSPYFRIFEWFMGAAAARFFLLRPDLPPGLGPVAGLFLAATLLFPLPADVFFFSVVAQNVLYAPFLAALLPALAARPRPWLTGRWLAAVSGASLSVYLVQTWTLEAFAPPPGAAFTAAGWRLAAGLVATVATGLAVSRYIEAPAGRWMMKSLRRPGA
jgi:peptidoglycan/LPS O-acetylase OafA/YrhL